MLKSDFYYKVQDGEESIYIEVSGKPSKRFSKDEYKNYQERIRQQVAECLEVETDLVENIGRVIYERRKKQ